MSFAIRKGPDGVTIDVSGKSGPNGSGGSSCKNSSSNLILATGSNGRPGGHAGPAEHGQNGGCINLELLPGSENSSTFQIVGKIIDPLHRWHDINQVVALPRLSDCLNLLANGGSGGRGGDGGSGEDGSCGLRGENASEYSFATAGGHGGDGGDAGWGTNGGNGGNGGNIVVHVHESRTNLLAFLGCHSTVGGSGGRAGSNGSPGSGGPGGSGGCGYSAPFQNFQLGGNSAGTSPNQNASNRRSADKPSAPNGPPGKSGRPGNPALTCGNDGQCGYFLIKVLNSQNFATDYREVYSLLLESAEIVVPPGCDDDGIVEPGEILRVCQIQVRNDGGMPTPRFTPILIDISPGTCKRITPNQQQRLVAPYDIAPGVSTIVLDTSNSSSSGGLDFEIHATADSSGSSMHSVGSGSSSSKLNASCSGPDASSAALDEGRASFGLRATIDGTGGRTFEKFCARVAQFTIPVINPIAFSPVPSTVIYICAGERTIVEWGIENRSNRNLGVQSSTGRGVLISVRFVDGRIPPDRLYVCLDSRNGSPLELQHLGGGSYRAAIPFLPANQKISLALAMQLNDVAPYVESCIEISLSLQLPRSPEQWRTIGKVRSVVRSSLRYRKTPGSSFLLVANVRTTFECISSWISLGKALGAQADIWDVSSQHDHFSLLRPLPETGRSLAEDFQDGCIVFLNSPFPMASHLNSDGAAICWPIDLLSTFEFQKATSNFNVRFYIHCAAWKSSNPDTFITKWNGLSMFLFPSQLLPCQPNSNAAYLEDSAAVAMASSISPPGATGHSSAEFRVKKSCFQCCKSEDKIFQAQCATFSRALARKGNRPEMRLLFVPLTSSAKGRRIRMIRLLDRQFYSRYVAFRTPLEDSVSVQRPETIFLFLEAISFSKKVSILEDRFVFWIETSNPQNSLFYLALLRSLTLDLVREASLIYGRTPPPVLSNSQNWLSSLSNFSLLLSQSETFFSLVAYRKCPFLDSFGSFLLQYVAAVGFVPRDFLPQSSWHAPSVKQFADPIVALVSARLAKFLSYDFKDSIPQFLKMNVPEEVKKFEAQLAYTSKNHEFRYLGAVLRFLLPPELQGSSDALWEGDAWSDLSDSIISEDLFQQLTK